MRPHPPLGLDDDLDRGTRLGVRHGLVDDAPGPRRPRPRTGVGCDRRLGVGAGSRRSARAGLARPRSRPSVALAAVHARRRARRGARSRCAGCRAAARARGPS